MNDLLHNVLIIKDGKDLFEKYVNTSIKEYGVDLLTWQDFIPPKSPLFQKVFCGIKKIKKLKMQGYFEKYDKIIVFEHTGIVVFLSLLANVKKNNLVLWLWNSKEKNEIKYVWWLKNFSRIYTFDYHQAQKYNWGYNNQFFLWADYNFPTIAGSNRSALFVGKNKKRLHILTQIEKYLLNANYTCDFNIYLDERERKDSFIKNEWVIKEMLSYENVLRKIEKCSVIVDITKEGQFGLTLRVLEALFYKKKLITNNKYICRFDFYNPNNIFVVGVDNWGEFDIFLESKLIEISDEIKQKYRFENWIDFFFKDK